MSCVDLTRQYREALLKKSLFGLLILTALIVTLIGSLGVGALNLSPTEIIDLLIRQEGANYHVLWNIRLSRAVGAVIAGAGLGVAGAIMQNVLRNPLASPFTIGVSQGAAFGAAFAIIVLDAGLTHRTGNEFVTIKMPYLVALCAFIGSLLTVGFILILSTVRNITAESIILAGVALSAFFGAATMLLQYFASDMQVAATVFWTFGDIGKAGWSENASMFIALILPFFYFGIRRWDFNAMQWGDEVARSLGVKVNGLRIISLVLSSLIVSVITSFLGIIGFIGLMAPHMVRFVVGSDYRFVIPYSALAGGLLLLLSDILARTLIAPVVLPVGIITSFAGAPLFLYLLVRGTKR